MIDEVNSTMETEMSKLVLTVTVAASILGLTATAFAGQGSRMVAQQPLNGAGQYSPGAGAPAKLAFSRIAGKSAVHQADRAAGTPGAAVMPERFANTVVGQSYPDLVVPNARSQTSAVQAVAAWHPDVAATPQTLNGNSSLQFPMGD